MPKYLFPRKETGYSISDMTEKNENGISEMLLSAMKSKNMTVEKLAQTTGVSDRFLELILEEQFEKLPSSPYLHGYIIKISETLGLEGEKIWNDFFKHAGEVKKSGAGDTIPKNRFVARRRNKKTIAFAIIGGIVIAYAIFQVFSFFKNPELSLDGIDDGMVVSTSTLHIKGSVDPRNGVFLNGEPLYPDENGIFEKDILLVPGFNTLKFTVKKFLGNEYDIEKRIFFETSTIPRDERSNRTDEFFPLTEGGTQKNSEPTLKEL